MKEIRNLPVQFNERIHAFSIDYGVVFLSMLITIFLYIHPAFKIIIIIFVWYMMNVFPSFIKRGITLGKLNSKTIVVDECNNEVTLITIHKRSFFILIAGFFTVGLYFIISLFLLTKRNDKRSIHDLLFNTKVVYKDSYISG